MYCVCGLVSDTFGVVSRLRVECIGSEVKWDKVTSAQLLDHYQVLFSACLTSDTRGDSLSVVNKNQRRRLSSS